MGMSFAKPVRHLREYLAVLGPLSRASRSPSTARTTGCTPASSVAGSTPFPIVVAALGPQMLKATAELADGTLTWCTGPETLADLHDPDDHRRPPRPPAGRRPRVIAALPVCVTDDVAAARERAAKVFAVYGQLPSYRAMLDREGASRGRPTSPSSARPTRSASASPPWPTSASPTSPPSSSAATPTRSTRHGRPWSPRCPADGPARSPGPALLGLTMAVVACSAGPGVRTEEASQRVEDTAPPTTTARSPVSTVDWSTCPDLDPDLTLAWECASVAVPLDHADPSGEQITVALTRPQLDAGDDRRPLVLDPGGPGASGIELAWHLVDVLPGELLDHYYPVGWDPRGVGRSTPPVDCGPIGAFDIPAAEDCIAGTGALAVPGRRRRRRARPRTGPPGPRCRPPRLPRLQLRHGARFGLRDDATPRASAASCSTAPSTRRPAIRSARCPADGVPDYAADELDDVIDRFHELCDASPLCAAGPDSAALVDDLEAHDPRPADGRLRGRPVADEPHRPRRPDGRDHLRPVVVGPRRRRPARRRRGRRLDARRPVQLPARRLPGRGHRRGRAGRVRRRPLRHLLRRLQQRPRRLGLRGHAGRPIRCR